MILGESGVGKSSILEKYVNKTFNSAINIDTSDGINWTIAFSLLAERTDIQEDVCLTANLPDLFGCYGDRLNCFLDAYATAQTTFPRIWNPDA
jgi:hypothetical protein